MYSSSDISKTKGTLVYTVQGVRYDFGILTSIDESFNKSATTVPLVSLSYKDTFAVESGSFLNYSFRFTRVQPLDADDSVSDSSRWSNMFWYEKMTELMTRWQARTDGGVLTYTPSNDNPFIPPFSYNGYIKSISKRYEAGRNTELDCSMEFHVGTMYAEIPKYLSGDETVPAMKKNDFQVLMSDAKQGIWYPLMGSVRDNQGKVISEINCIRSYKLFGGVEVPFEHASFTIPRDRLAAIAPDLVKASNIVAGKNKILLNAVGKSAMYVSNVSLSNNVFKIDAYCEATVLRDMGLDLEYTDTPFNWIKSILSEGRYGVAFREGTDTTRGTFIYSYVSKDDADDDRITFTEGTNVWTILQICSTYLGCKLFFANGNAYLMDYRRTRTGYTRHESANPAPHHNSESEEINLYTGDDSNPLYRRTCGPIDIPREGLDVIVNFQPIKCQGFDEDGKKIRFVYEGGKNQASINTFGVVEGNLIDVPGLIQGKDDSGDVKYQAETFAKAYLDYRAEPQQPIAFTLKEMQKDKDGSIEWSPFFEPTAAVGSIKSLVHSTIISNVSVLDEGPGVPSRVPQKLILSQFERKYPEGTTMYYFGQISTIDLSSSTSQIFNNLNNL